MEESMYDIKGLSTKAKSRRENMGHIFKLIAAPTGYPKKCQFIEASPTRAQLRERGGDSFKCLAATRDRSPYCDVHHKRCFMGVPKKFDEKILGGKRPPRLYQPEPARTVEATPLSGGGNAVTNAHVPPEKRTKNARKAAKARHKKGSGK